MTESDQLTLAPEQKDLEQKIEAVLFMSSKSMSIIELEKATGADAASIKLAIKNLQEIYSQRGSWIEFIRVDKSFLMRLKPERTDTVSSFVQETELSKRALRVLAIVAQRDGILQSKVSRMLGAIVYDAVPELVQKGYLHTEIKGHSKVLKLTQKFRNYFGEIPVGGNANQETSIATEAAPSETQKQDQQ
ncbi:Segregation and condensation protein B [uncultured archaeon]|nr:Segregation and condensation protein B [uncultured archaeon]